MIPDLTLTGARVLRPTGWDAAPLTLSGGQLSDDTGGRRIDLSGYDVLPGIVDLHGDGFERHMAPRRGALREAEAGVVATAAELAANGITTGFLAQFWSWEGGMRGPDFAQHVFASVASAAPGLPVDLRLQLRLETHLLDDLPLVVPTVLRFGIGYVVFNDHLPHDRLAAGRRPKQLTGQALKSGRNPEVHLAMMTELHNRAAEVPAAMDRLCADLAASGVALGSHDDPDAETRAAWRARGVRISEFPESLAAAEAARAAGDAVILGAPNLVRGASHKGNVAARDVVAAGCCDALASDYHYPSLVRAARRLVELGLCDSVAAWTLVSSGPARVLGLADRGRLEDGLRADLVVMERESGRIVATVSGGQVAWMSGAVAARFLAEGAPHPSARRDGAMRA